MLAAVTFTLLPSDSPITSLIIFSRVSGRALSQCRKGKGNLQQGFAVAPAPLRAVVIFARATGCDGGG